MAAIIPGHIISAREGPIFGQFTHLDDVGMFIEDISTEPLTSGTSAFVDDMQQSYKSLYVLVRDIGVFPPIWAIQEFTELDGTYVRTVLNESSIDASDPVQNPFGIPQADLNNVFRLTLDDQRNIYIYSGGDAGLVRKYSYAGTFIEAFENDEITSSGYNSLLVKPDNPTEIIDVNNVGTPRIARWDMSTHTSLGGVVISSGQGSFATKFRTDSSLIRVTGTSFSGSIPAPLLRVISNLYVESVGIAIERTLSTDSAYVARSGDDLTKAWIVHAQTVSPFNRVLSQHNVADGVRTIVDVQIVGNGNTGQFSDMLVWATQPDPPPIIKYPGIARVPRVGTTQDLFVRTTP